MKEYKTKSVILGRIKRKDLEDDQNLPCFISLFDINDPHKNNIVPKKRFEFDKVHKVIIENLNINYLLAGNDLVINDLESIKIKVDKGHIHISGKQKRI